VIAVVDARNVVRSRWPNLEEARFLELTRCWAERETLTRWSSSTAERPPFATTSG
jgi:hypothetical protein